MPSSPPLSPPEECGAWLRQVAEEEGFAHAGCADADPSPQDVARLRDWCAEGRHGDMAWLPQSLSLREHPERLLPGVRSVLVTLAPYPFPDAVLPPGTGRISSHAWGRDYHTMMKQGLLRVGRRLTQRVPGVQWRAFVDSGPVLERALAVRAGLGFIGHNRMLITPWYGPLVHIGILLTTLSLASTAAEGGAERDCGSCRACLDACPTGALDLRKGLDARRCLAHLTIEQRREPPPALVERLGDRLYGCDACAAACPFALKGRHAPRPAWTDAERRGFDLAEVLAWDDASAAAALRGTSLKRRGREGLQQTARWIAPCSSEETRR